MNCNCIEQLEKKVLEKFPEVNGKPVVETKLQTIWALQDDKMNRLTSTDIMLSLEGQKKQVAFAVNHTYCPFCGTKQL